MYHITEDGPKRCSTTPDKCPILKKNPDAEHYEDIKDAYAAYEAEMGVQTFKGLQKTSEEELRSLGFRLHDVNPREHTSPSKIAEYAEKSRGDISRLSEEERRAIDFYTGSDYRRFQRVLFRRVEPTSSEREVYQEVMKNLDAAIDKATREDKIVYRGMTGTATILEPDFEAMEEDFDAFMDADWDHDDFDEDPFEDGYDTKLNEYVEEKLRVGKTVEFEGYQSTTLSPFVASDYATGGILFEIKTPEGLNVMSESNFQNEEEVILPRRAGTES